MLETNSSLKAGGKVNLYSNLVLKVVSDHFLPFSNIFKKAAETCNEGKSARGVIIM